MPLRMHYAAVTFAGIVVAAWYLFWLATPINLATADLGRHITNGRIMVTEPEHRHALLTTNYYSYTHPDSPFTNHHWGSGVVFYLLHVAGGFSTVHLFFICISIATLLIVFDLARRTGSTFLASVTTVALIPFIASRVEVRPEGFSYLLFSVFLWILWQHRSQTITRKWLWVLVPLQVIWVNLHSYFIVGIGAIGVFAIDALINKKFPWLYGKLLIAALAASLINPFGYHSLLLPLTLLTNYGYRIVENQSIRFLEEWGMQDPNFFTAKVIIALLLVSYVIVLVQKIRNKQTLPIAQILLVMTFSAMAWGAIRNFTLLGLFAIPALSSNIFLWKKYLLRADTYQRTAIYVISTVIVAATVYLQYVSTVRQQAQRLGFGLVPDIEKAAEYITQHAHGPIFNNYDIGGYLIYHLYAKEKVFTDNRPEAYPASFFEDTYVPMQEDEAIWKEQMAAYGFKTIIFWRHDLTPWARIFMANRLADKNWLVSYADSYILVLKRP